MTAFLTREKSVGWYNPPVTSVVEPVRDLLEKYAGFPPDKVIPQMVEMVRRTQKHDAKSQMDLQFAEGPHLRSISVALRGTISLRGLEPQSKRVISADSDSREGRCSILGHWVLFRPRHP